MVKIKICRLAKSDYSRTNYELSNIEIFLLKRNYPGKGIQFETLKTKSISNKLNKAFFRCLFMYYLLK